MGHSIQHYTFDEKENRNTIEARVNEDAIYESDSRSELPSHIRFIENKVYSDQQAAHEAIEKLDKGWYDQLAVKYNSFEKVKETKTIANLRDRITKAEQGLLDYKSANAIKNRKSQYAGCTKCGSKVNKDYIADSGYNWNKCPLCGEELSSKTVLNSITNKRDKIDEMTKDLNKKVRENSKKGKKSVKWLVKTEFHI